MPERQVGSPHRGQTIVDALSGVTIINMLVGFVSATLWLLSWAEARCQREAAWRA